RQKAASSLTLQQCLLLCDSSKYNQVATFMALPLTRFTTIITDRHLSDAAASHIARHACEVLRAG
ncbi:DeoR family transcriptional regulator, partial [Salmonella enterica subsp. enterica serovar Miami]|nr:DeoR family transcriptional regulator [Salmonella enterica subsp. enterica serovar Miami]